MNERQEHDVPDAVKHLIGDQLPDNAPRGDGGLDYESFLEEYRPEAVCQDENRNDEDADDPRDVPPPTECLDYVPSRHELLQLARYWVRETLSFPVNFHLFGFTGSYESKLVALGGERLRQLETVLGAEAVQSVVKQVEDEYRWGLGDRLWEIFTKGTQEELEAARDEIRANWPDSIMPARAVPQGLLPADIGVRDCAPETWLEFGAYCGASGIREKVSEQVRTLWEEFTGRMEAASES